MLILIFNLIEVTFLRETFIHFSNINQGENEDRKGVALSTFEYLKLAVWDVPTSIVDISLDFSIGFYLIHQQKTKNYGILSLVINWVPALVAFFYVSISLREKYSVAAIILISIFTLITYPLLLTLTSVYTLLKRPKNNEVTEDFHKTLEYLTIIQAISGKGCNKLAQGLQTTVVRYQCFLSHFVFDFSE